MTAPAPHTLTLDVRDYECDLQGIVNNAVYLHYFEHARHQFLKVHGFDFDALNREGLHLVVVRATVDYKAPLRSGDRFAVASRLRQSSPVRFQFLQEIHRALDQRLMVQGVFDCAAMNRQGRPILPRLLEPLFKRVSGT
jgi:acyl-CoA thioester hydrolase